jgi:FkbM family methyltransferase
MEKYFSQKKQDKWIIEEIFNFKLNGYFIDLAAYDGITLNNTYLLEKKLNWNGICIEPFDKAFTKLKKNRNCILVNDVIDYNNDNEIKFRTDIEMGNGIIDNDTDNNYNTRKSGKYGLDKSKFIVKKTKTLEFILDTNNAPKVIDYLSLDVEGSETRILSNFPFNKYKFLALTIERPTIELENILFQNDYVFVKHYEMDTFYVHKTIPNFDNIKKETYQSTPKKDW